MSLEIEAVPSTPSSLERVELQLGGLGPGEEAERGEGRAEPGRDVQHRARTPVQAARVGEARVGEPDLPARIGDRDLSVVEMAGEDEVEDARLERVDDARVMAEEDPQVGVRVGQRGGPGAAGEVRRRVDADELHTEAAE